MRWLHARLTEALGAGTPFPEQLGLEAQGGISSLLAVDTQVLNPLQGAGQNPIADLSTIATQARAGAKFLGHVLGTFAEARLTDKFSRERKAVEAAQADALRIQKELEEDVIELGAGGQLRKSLRGQLKEAEEQKQRAVKRKKALEAQLGRWRDPVPDRDALDSMLELIENRLEEAGRTIGDGYVRDSQTGVTVRIAAVKAMATVEAKPMAAGPAKAAPPPEDAFDEAAFDRAFGEATVDNDALAAGAPDAAALTAAAAADAARRAE